MLLFVVWTLTAGAGLAISMLGGGIFSAVAAVFWTLRAPLISFFTTVGLVQVEIQFTHSLKGAWFQPLNQKCDFLVSSLCSFEFNLYRYTTDTIVVNNALAPFPVAGLFTSSC